MDIFGDQPFFLFSFCANFNCSSKFSCDTIRCDELPFDLLLFVELPLELDVDATNFDGVGGAIGAGADINLLSLLCSLSLICDTCVSLNDLSLPFDLLLCSLCRYTYTVVSFFNIFTVCCVYRTCGERERLRLFFPLLFTN